MGDSIYVRGEGKAQKGGSDEELHSDWSTISGQLALIRSEDTNLDGLTISRQVAIFIYLADHIKTSAVKVYISRVTHQISELLPIATFPSSAAAPHPGTPWNSVFITVTYCAKRCHRASAELSKA
jgi:hypothetical protein